MEPTSAWVVDYADHSCALRRAFSGNGREAVLELRQSGPSDIFMMLVASDLSLRRLREPSIRFLPDDKAVELVAPTFATGEEGMNAVRFGQSLRPHFGTDRFVAAGPWTEQERDVREKATIGLELTDAFERDLTLQTGELHQAMTALRACVDDLLGQSGVDAQALRTLSRPVRAIKPAEWVRRVMQAYPADMARAGRSARVQIRLTVGPDGMPTACSVRGDPVHPSFERAACNSSMRHARFEPALDAQGQPVASYYDTTVAYTRP